MPEDPAAFHKLLKAVQAELQPAHPKAAGRRKGGKHVLNRLSDLDVRKRTAPGAYADGGGLYLHITSTGAKSWVFRYARKLGNTAAKAREMGLGSINTVSLAEAREKALACRKLLDEGIDPIDHRGRLQVARMQEQIAAAVGAEKGAMTFDKCVAEFINGKRHEWGNDKHEQQFENTLKTYASPMIGAVPVALIDTPAVVKVFEKNAFWTSKTETAKRVRQRIEAVLDWARVMGYRHGDNPARWDGCLEHLLAKPTKIQTVRPMPSLPYAQLPAFVAALRQQKGVGALALEFAILTAMRTGPVRGATWNEIDFDNATWTIPAGHMKGQKGNKKEHRVPLGSRAIALLRSIYAEEKQPTDIIFPGSGGGPMSDMTIAKVVKTMNKDKKLWTDPKLDNAEIVPHGFRSTFSTWVAEATEYPEDLREACLAHAVKNKVMAAYQRGDLFDKRRALMADWAEFAEGAAI